MMTEQIEPPIKKFQSWLSEAETLEINDPNAMNLATCDATGQPRNRIVLLKGLDERGFVFYTNTESRKGRDLADNQRAALCFHWKSLQKQVRIEGSISFVSDDEADAYYNSRHRNSRIGAWASHQSRPMETWDDFDKRFAEYTEKFEGTEDIPRPEYWRGYRLTPHYIEFWVEKAFRLHDRLVYTRENNNQNWQTHMLYP